MSIRSFLIIPIFLALAALISAPDATAQAPLKQAAPGLDGRFLELAAQIPGFGGYYFDSNGDLVAQLTDISKSDLARAALVDIAANRPERMSNPWPRPAAIVTRLAAFDFYQLSAWRNQLEAATSSDWWLTDADEQANQVLIGVIDTAARDRVLQASTRLGIPRAALNVEVIPRGSLLQTLQQYVRPLEGGLQIDFTLNGQPSQCTLGVNVWYGNLAQGIPLGTAGFYTASHCSTTWGGTDSTVYSQGGVRIGQERYDPGYFTYAYDTSCPANLNCRWSDVSFVAYDSGTDGQHGAIAQTNYRAYGVGLPGPPQDMSKNGSIDINPGSPQWTITNTALPVTGAWFEKLGRSTGWTTGQVSQTCMNIRPDNVRDVLCQDRVDAYAYYGDSGGPAFQWLSSSSAAFSGIVWYQYVDPNTHLAGFVFSNINMIAKDMGSAVNYLTH